MEPVNRKVGALVDMLMTGELLLPEMQRRFVWDSTQIRTLVDSLYRGYPSGSILIWETESLPDTREVSLGGVTDQSIGRKLLLLDGQQRLTSLASVITGRPLRVRKGGEARERIIDLRFNVDHLEEFDLEEKGALERFFQLQNKTIEGIPHWISVTRLFKEGVGSILKDLRVGYDHPKYECFNARLNKPYNVKEYYLYPVQILRNMSYKEVTSVFVRVNSAGTKLRESDLALAQITSRWKGSMKLLEEKIEQSAKEHFIFDEGFLARCLVAVATGRSGFDTVGRIPLKELQTAWENAKEGIDYTINFVRANGSIDASEVLPSPYPLVPLIVMFSKRRAALSAHEERAFLHWLYSAGMWGRYSGAIETKLDADLAALDSDDPPRELVRNLLSQFGRLQVTHADLEGRGKKSPLYFMMYVSFKRMGAKDWETGLALSVRNIGRRHRIEDDHIFPKSVLNKHLKDKYDDKARKRLVNELANLAFLSKRGNVVKRAELPADYLPRVIERRGEDALRTQCIPLDSTLWQLERYGDFLSERRRLIADAFNDLLAHLKAYDELPPARAGTAADDES